MIDGWIVGAFVLQALAAVMFALGLYFLDKTWKLIAVATMLGCAVGTAITLALLSTVDTTTSIGP